MSPKPSKRAARALARAELESLVSDEAGGNVEVTSGAVRVWWCEGSDPPAVALAFEYKVRADSSGDDSDADCVDEGGGVMVHVARAGAAGRAAEVEQSPGLRSMGEAARLVAGPDVFGEHALELEPLAVRARGR